MKPYDDIGNNSGVIAYKIAANHIVVQFRQGKNTFYCYNHAITGYDSVESMKSLAEAGHGLNSYISTNDPRYAARGNSLTEVE